MGIIYSLNSYTYTSTYLSSFGIYSMVDFYFLQVHKKYTMCKVTTAAQARTKAGLYFVNDTCTPVDQMLKYFIYSIYGVTAV